MGVEVPDGFLFGLVAASKARLLLAQRRVDDALAEFEALVARAQRFGLENPAFLGHKSGLALALLRRGHSQRAASVATEELELARRWGAPREIGVSLRTLALCHSGDDQLELLHESVESLGVSGAALEHAHSLVELGSAMRRSGERAAAREPLHAGMERAHRCGATPLAERAREELVATGARPRRIMRSGVDALTPSELRVARMAAEGLTNREIAQELFVTARTVEGHLTHAFQKLDIESRRDLAGRLSDESGA